MNVRADVSTGRGGPLHESALETPALPPPSVTPAANAAPRPRVKTSFHLWIRRAHLYAGLFLAPFVVIYGASAVIFNHGGWFSSGAPPRKETVDVSGVTWADPAALAATVVAALGSGVTLDPAVAPALTGDVVLQGDLPGGDERRAQIRVDTKSGEATVRVGEPTAKAPFPTRTKLDPALKEPVAALATRARTLVPGGDGLEVKGAPQVRFGLLDAAGGRWAASVDLGKGTLAVRPAPTGPDTARLLTGLHTIHGYPEAAPTARFAWAIVVDVMAVAFLFWTASGIFMWWGMLKLRKVGLLSLAGGVTLAALLALAMRETLAR